MDFPQWVTLSNLGNFQQDYSFDLNPISIEFSADNFEIILLNGIIPEGLSWQYTASMLTITGASDPSPNNDTIFATFTFRIIQTNSTIADRTYTLTLIPISIAPDWTNQSNFLGYQNNVSPSTYQISAIAPIGVHILYNLEDHPSGMSITPSSGIITYLANNIITNSTVIFNVNASTSSASSLVDLSIIVLSNPSGPEWVTSSGDLETSSGGDYIEFNLIAEDVSGTTVNYELISSDSGFTLSVAPDGLLYGRLPSVNSYTVYSFNVRAFNSNGTTNQNFSISVDVLVNNDLSWVTESELGSIDEGQIINIPILAISKNKNLILYNITGGILPPNLMIGIVSGSLLGFIEYHALSKIYYFDITASTETQSITQQFSITINKIYGDRFLSAYFPVTGLLKNQLSIDSGNIRVREPGNVAFDQIENIPINFSMTIINGIEIEFETADSIVDSIHNQLYQPDLQFGMIANTVTDSSNLSIIYREIVDNQLNSNLSVYSGAVYNTNIQTNGLVYPISINNLRLALIHNRQFISSGGGVGANLSPVIDWSTGTLLSVDIINSGSGYTSPPLLTVIGSGIGASVQAFLGLLSINILDIGNGWNVGDQVALTGYVYNIVAIIGITAVGPNGSLSQYEIINSGNYSQVSAAQSTLLSLGNAYANISLIWGIIEVDVISGGQDYQCGISIDLTGQEILPWYQSIYSPVIEQGQMPIATAQLATQILNYENNTLWGTLWNPSILVLQWQGIQWYGETSFDEDITTFDGGGTSFQETLDPLLTTFDDINTVFEDNTTLFDYSDPKQFNLFQIWGGTLFDTFLTTFDLYATSFDQLLPSTMSRTVFRKLITMHNEIYSGNNSVI